jgi:hypothetical protein
MFLNAKPKPEFSHVTQEFLLIFDLLPFTLYWIFIVPTYETGIQNPVGEK